MKLTQGRRKTYQLEYNNLLSSPQVSIVLATRNRHSHLKDFLTSLLSSTYKKYELIILDQSDTEPSPQILRLFKKIPRVLYIKSDTTGKSRGLNQAIQKTTAPLLAFTDDDCIVSKNWIYEIQKSYSDHPKISGVLGVTKPYNPQKLSGRYCPSTFIKSKMTFIKTPQKHWIECGLGNNMSFRKSIFNNFKNFKEWLGPGSIGLAAEDGEIILKFLINRRILFFNPKMIMFHNRWLNKEQFRKQQLIYIAGEMACYGWLMFNKHRIGSEVVTGNLSALISEVKYDLKCILILKRNSKIDINGLLQKIIYISRGLAIAFIYTFVIPDTE